MRIYIHATLAIVLFVLIAFLSDPTLAGNKEALNYIAEGNQEVTKRNIEAAIEKFSQAIKADPKFHDAYVLRGSVYRDTGRLDKAIEDYTAALDIGPNYDAYFNRAIAYTDMGDASSSIKDYTSAIKIDSKQVYAFNNRAILYALGGDLKKAISDFSSVIALDPKNVMAINNRHSAYRDSGKMKKAIEDLERVAELKPTDPGPYYNMSRVYSLMGNPVFACKKLDKAVSMGFKDFATIGMDPALNNVRDSSCFKKIVGGR